MPQSTNLNIFPYNDDYDLENDYYKVLFKPGFPVQARELTTLQSILNNQIEQFGNNIFKEGSVVVPGTLSLVDGLDGIILEESYLGLKTAEYIPFLVGSTVTGATSGVKAKIYDVDVNNPNLVYIVYEQSTEIATKFFQGETLTVDSEVFITSSNNTSFKSGESVGVISELTSNGCKVVLTEGIFFLKGYFVRTPYQRVVLSPFGNVVNARVGLLVTETVVTAEEDPSLYDNSRGFENFAAPGSDRLKIQAKLVAYAAFEDPDPNFVELVQIREGKIIAENILNPQYNILANEFARRTYDESGNYYVDPFTVQVKDSLNDFTDERSGLFYKDNITFNGNVASESLGIYKISSGKAYVKGFEVLIPAPNLLDFEKPRTTSTLENQSINYFTGPTFTVNRVTGVPKIGFSTSYYVNLRDERLGSDATIAPGKNIGVARVYDFALESGSYNSTVPDINQWDLSLYDLQLYTEITLNENLESLTTSCQVKGKSSSATGFLVNSVTNSNTLFLYSINGRFLFGEELLFNGAESNRIITSITTYEVGDVKSVYSDQNGIFSGDILQNEEINIGQVSITPIDASTGVSTVTKIDYDFNKTFKVNNTVSFSSLSSNFKNISKVTSVSETQLEIVGLTTITGIYEGGLYSTEQFPADFSLVKSKLQSSTDNSFYTPLPKKLISSVDLSSSSIIIRKVFNVNISNNSVIVPPQEVESNEVFLPFDEERYILTRSDGSFEILTSDKVTVTSGGKELVINGLGANDVNATLVATVRRNNVTSKVKIKNKVKTIVIDKSNTPQSGIGATTNNDGLTFGNYPYGTRVQDEEICLLYPDVTKIHAIYESNSVNDPLLPSISISNIQSVNSSAFDVLIGERLETQTGAVALVADYKNESEIFIVMLNDALFAPGEEVTFVDSTITATVSSTFIGDKNITSKYTLESSQNKTISSYSKIRRNANYSEPSKKLKICFEYASVSSSDTGDLVTVDSYFQFDYCNLFEVDGLRASDIIDNRPRVDPYIVEENKRSPFEFEGRSFETNNLKILVPDESITLDYSYYLPRIDKIFLTREKQIILKTGVPSETPEPPEQLLNALEICTIFLPAYLCDINQAKITLKRNKRYQMKDISDLEDRIKNLEYYSSLSLLETNTTNLQIKDAQGVERFKSGIFVDNFTTTSPQFKKTIVKNSIDVQNGELRPTSYTTFVDLLLGTKSLSNGNSANIDPKFDTDLIGQNIRKSVTDSFGPATSDTNGIITLDYQEVLWIEQKFASRVENVTPYLVTFYSGNITLNPSSDIWVDQVRLETNTVEGLLDGFTESQVELNARELDPSVGWSPVLWNAWQTNWTGSTSQDSVRSQTTSTVIQGRENQTNGSATATTDTTIRTTTRTGTETRNGTSSRIRYTQGNNYNLGDRILAVEVSPFMRSRNIEFIARRMRPNTTLFASFDNRDVTSYIVPKLLRVEILSGSFEIGETVIGGEINSLSSNFGYIQFRVCQLNHRSGPFDAPTDIFQQNPYTQVQLGSEYSSTEEIVNIDTTTLGLQNQGRYFGSVVENMLIVGQSSGCRARIISTALVTDETGTAIGSFFIPNPNAQSGLRFNTGNADFVLSDSRLEIFGTTKATSRFFSTGSITPVQSTVISTRTAERITAVSSEFRSVSDTVREVVNVSTTVNVIDPQPVPVPVPLPIPVPVPLPIALPPVAPPFGGAPRVSPIAAVPAPVFVPTPFFVPTPAPAAFFPLPAPRPQGRPPVFIPRPVAPPPVTPPNRFTRLSRPVSVFTTNPLLAIIAARQGGFGARGGGGGGGNDPIAQSFDVPPSGCFVTSVDLFFQSKDPNPNQSVFIELRPLVLGLPDSETRHPLSYKILYSKDIQVSDDASVPTRVNFEAPVYLEGGKQHAIIIGSFSTEFTAWISRAGEVDVSLASGPESAQVPISPNTFLGSFFKSQNQVTWTPAQYDDLKFNLYIAEFAPEGSVSFFNPNIDNVTLKSDSIKVLSNKISVGIGTTVNILNPDFTISPGNTVFQEETNATGNYVGGAGICTGSLGVINSGIGYTPFSGSLTYNNVPLTSMTGNGNNATANITIENGVAIAATIVSGGNGYLVGDMLTADSIGNDNLGRNLSLSVSNIFAINTLVLDNVQGDFVVGSGKTIKFVTSAGIETGFSDNADVFIESTPTVISDGLHFKVNHVNHGMHSSVNNVSISNVRSDTSPVELTTTLSSENEFTVTDASDFVNFENYPVSESNPGYVFIDSELISYTSINGNTLSGITRGVDSTVIVEHSEGSFVYKYELSGISLRRINKTHTLQDATINPVEGRIGLDHYYIKVDLSTNGLDRTVDNGDIPSLKFNETKTAGGPIINCSRNIQYEIINPVVQTLILPTTNLTAKCRTTSGTSISGAEPSFEDSGFSSLSLTNNNYFDSPRLVSSQLNESILLNDVFGNKSLEVRFDFSTDNVYLSPVIDLDRVGLVLVSNRVNAPITDYINDSRVSTIAEDPTAFSYITKPIELEIPATSIRIIVSAYVNTNSDIRAFFAVGDDTSTFESPVYYPFPGFTNRIESGELIDINLNNGTSDRKIQKVDNFGFGSNDVVFKDYEFSIDNLSSFKFFSIKLLGTSTNQSYPPRFRDLRIIALA